jgi:uncharacterized membrane protein
VITITSIFKKFVSIKQNKIILCAAVFFIYMFLACLFVYMSKTGIKNLAMTADFNPSGISQLYILCVSGFCVFYFLLIGLWIMLYKKLYSIEKVFVIVCLIFGLFYLFIMPPFSVPDEPMHYLKAYSTAQGRVVAKNDSNGYYITLRKSDKKMFMAFAPTANKYDVKTYRKINSFLNSKVTNVDNQAVNVSILSGMNAYSPLLYIPAAFGIAIGKIFHFNPMIIFYIGRLFNLICFIAIMYFAIKKLPFVKPLFFCIALLPMTMQLAASYSSDCILIALVLFYIASCINLSLREENVRRKDIILLIITSVIIATFKLVYFPVCFLFLIIPKEKFNKIKDYFISFGILAVSSIISWGSWMLFSSKYIMMTNLKSESNILKNNISYIFSNTFDYIFVIYNTLASQIENYIKSMIGSSLGWLNLAVNYVFIYAFIALLIIIVLNNYRNEKYAFTRIQKLCMFIIAVAVIGLVETSMFISWSKQHAEIIEGVQGRYFLPVLPLILLLLKNKIFYVKKNIEKQIIFAICVLQYFSIVNVLGDILKLYK